LLNGFAADLKRNVTGENEEALGSAVGRICIQHFNTLLEEWNGRKRNAFWKERLTPNFPSNV